jgi:hypothetical protein
MRYAIAIIVLVSIMSTAAAGRHYDRLDFNPLKGVSVTEIARPGDEVFVRTNLLNRGNVDLENVRVSAFMPELGLFARTGRFDLDEDERAVRVLFFDIPHNTEPGLYLVMVTAQNHDSYNFRSRVFRFVYVC